MRKINKILAFLLTVTMVSVFFACANSGGNDSNGDSESDNSWNPDGIYTITIADGITNGTVTADLTSAHYGTTVTLSIAPHEEYRLITFFVTTDSGSHLPISGTGNTRTFTMPPNNVTVSAVFMKFTYEQFGSWPQSLIADDVTVNDGAESKIVGSNTYYKGSDGEWYAEVNYEYYKVEPIKWRVLTTNYNGTGKKLLFAENILTSCEYYDYDNVNRTVGTETIYPSNYEYSRMRAFLNGLSYPKKSNNSASQETDESFLGKGFLQTAFTLEEQARIATTSVINNARSTNPDANATQWSNGNNPYASNTPTYDKIFLLSVQEATKIDYAFGPYDYFCGVENTRIRKGTAFAIANGLSWDSTLDGEGYGASWTLRSPDYFSYPYYELGYDSSYDCSDRLHEVDKEGKANSTGGVNGLSAVVPALCLE